MKKLITSTITMLICVFTVQAQMDTVDAMVLVHPNGWSAMIDSGDGLTSSATVTGDAGAPAQIAITRVAQPNDSTWPYADMLGAMSDSGSLAKLKNIIITYTINSVSAEADGFSFAITSGYNTSIESAGWARFNAVLTGGGATPTVGTERTDTLSLADFKISWGSTAIPENTTLADSIGLAYLATANSLTFTVESEAYTADQSLDLTVSRVFLVGDAGLANDMHTITPVSHNFATSKGVAHKLISSVSQSSMNLDIPVAGNYSVKLVSAKGQVLFSTTKDFSEGKQSLSLAGTMLKSGVVYAQISSGNATYSQRISVQ